MARLKYAATRLAAPIAIAFALMGLTPINGTPWAPAGTFVTAGPSYGLDDATSQCRPPPPDICTYDYPLLDKACTVADVAKLGRFGSDRYLTIRYLRSRTFDDSEAHEPFICKADEIYLVAVAPDGQARTVWRDASEREFVFISSVKHVSLADGKTILAILYCLNGTGGCTQGMLIWDGERWKKLAYDASWDAVYRNLPAGYRPHKSPEIDLANLTWEQHLAYETDANCCPSGKILFKLAIVDDKLSVTSYQIVVPDAR